MVGSVLSGLPSGLSHFLNPSWFSVFPAASRTTPLFPDRLKTRHSHGMKRKIHKESTQRTKVSLGFVLPCICILRKKKLSLQPVSLPTSIPTCLPSEKSYRIQYITFCFTSLELHNERAGNRKKNLPKSRTEYDSLWICTEIRGNSRAAFFFFFLFLKWHP